MSLSETQAIFQELQRIEALLSNVEKNSASLERRLPEVTAVVITTQQALRLTWRFSRLLRRMGLPEDAAATINTLNKIARTATYTYYALNLLSMGTPYGVIAGLIGITTVTMTSADILAGY